MRQQLMAALVVLGLAAGGCAGTGGDTGRTASGVSSPSSSPEIAPKDLLLAAVPDDSQGSFTYTMKDSLVQMSGVVDPAAATFTTTAKTRNPELGFTMTMTFVGIGGEAWMKVALSGTQGLTGLPKLPRKWMSLDWSKTDLDNVGVPTDDDADPAGAAALFRSIVDVEPAGEGEYQGTMDLTRAKGAELVDEETAGALGGKATSVPFRATVDGAKRLTSLSVELPAVGKDPKRTHTISYGRYGKAPRVSRPPAAQVTEAPAAAYELLNG